jgi:AraC-like DNA-binding protein
MEFLTQWRLTLAADLILDPQETVASVARTVGYSSPYALSAAFKRERGISPQQHRTAQRQPVDPPDDPGEGHRVSDVCACQAGRPR